MQSLGIITVAARSTPARLSSAGAACSCISLQAYKALGAAGTPPTKNTGNVYLMKGNYAKGTLGANCIAVIEPGDAMFTLRATNPAGLNISDYYLDSDTNGDGALVSFE